MTGGNLLFDPGRANRLPEPVKPAGRNRKKAGTAPAFRDPEPDQKEISLFLETRMKISMEVIVSTFRMVASAAAGPSEPRVTCA